VALGTLTLIDAPVNGGNAASDPLFLEEVSLVGPASYTTGGDTGLQVAYRAKGVAQAHRTIINVLPVDGKGYQFGWNSTDGKLLVYYGNNDGVADGPAVEVANATDLSGTTFRLMIMSR